MGEKAESTTREALADFLRQRRDALSPDVVGLKAGRRRRTPGLRRDEVARLANMSTIYYERLEQGRGSQPSSAILAGLAQALRLDPDERAYLYLLAGHAEPAVAEPGGAADPRLLSVMRAVTTTFPAFVADELGTVTAQNALHTTLFGRVAGRPEREGNLFWCWFGRGRWRRSVLDPPERQEAIGHNFVAYLRMIVAKRGHDAAAAALVADLRAVSGEFLGMWDEHRVAGFSPPGMSVLDNRVGRLDFDCALMVSSQSTQRLGSLHAVPGTPTQQRLSRLAEHVPAPADREGRTSGPGRGKTGDGLLQPGQHG
ncbi:helix-turn-helix transcriptional regulator [Umezawaea endophytica]|uniref:Helix-turn-helix transcriptional regulator n=1 Tax=Umezawaea endophytica TaxID=1654476 RepID=A0A9X3A1F8_9PSEU|nr:helix-turn-helix transcriptional regulator [Umezawaea endophytica]MCS7477958.1 helix-turn-helix transcriptional regulator [Umezawaea endophytica]